MTNAFEVTCSRGEKERCRLQRTYSRSIEAEEDTGGGNFFDQADAELHLIVEPGQIDVHALFVVEIYSDNRIISSYYSGEQAEDNSMSLIFWVPS